MHLFGGQEKFGRETVGLVFNRLAAGLGFAVHDQVAELVSDIEPLAVVVALDGVEHDSWPVGGSE